MEESGELEKRECEKARALLTGYLNERMRVTISDGRVIDGRLICTDRDCNLVLSNCEEFLSQEEMSKAINFIKNSHDFVYVCDSNSSGYSSNGVFCVLSWNFGVYTGTVCG